MSTGRKHNDIEVEARISAIIGEVAKGNDSTRHLLRFIADTYNLSSSQAEKDIKRAKEIILSDVRKDRTSEIAAAVLRYKQLIQINMKVKDFREVRNCQNDLNKLLGLNEPDKIDHTTDGEKITKTEFF